MSELKNLWLRCPFCGEQLVNVTPSKIFYHENNGCLLSLKGFTNEDFDKWNRRKPMEDALKQLEEYAFDMSLENPDWKAVWLDHAIKIVKGEE